MIILPKNIEATFFGRFLKGFRHFLRSFFRVFSGRYSNNRENSAEFGWQILEFAIFLPFLTMLGIGLAEPLIVLHRYNKVYYQLTLMANEASEMEGLQEDIWHSNGGDKYERFVESRGALIQRYKSVIERFSGVQLASVMHNDRLNEDDSGDVTKEEWSLLPIGYFPPATSGYIPSWGGSSVNNAHVAGFANRSVSDEDMTDEDKASIRRNLDAFIRRYGGEENAPDRTVPLLQVRALGARGKPEFLIPKSTKWRTLPFISNHVPTEIIAPASIKGILFSYPLVISVPFFPNSRVREFGAPPEIKPRWTRGDWSGIIPSCGSWTQTRVDTDDYDNEQTLSRSGCNVCWFEQHSQACKPTNDVCGSGFREVTENDSCGSTRLVSKPCIATACQWQAGSWSSCSASWSAFGVCTGACGSVGTQTRTCSGGLQTRSVYCGLSGQAVPDSLCSSAKPSSSSSCGCTGPASQSCTTPACPPCYYQVSWTINKNVGQNYMNANDGAGGCWNAGCRDHGVGLKVNGGNLCGYNFQVATEGFLGRHATDTLLNYRYGAANDTEGSKNAWGTLMLNRFALPVAVKNALTHIVANTAQGSSSTHYFDSAGCGLLSSTDLAGRSVCSNGYSVFTENLWSPISLFAEDDSKLSGRLVNFALDPSKEKQLVQWFGSEATPLLVWDPTHSGKIVDGSQLFGSFTFGKSWSDGYKALASIDVNGDGELSGGELEPLGVWVDRNQDAVSQDGEVLKVSEFGVLRIFVVSDLEQPDIEKGLIWAKKGYVRKTEDGTEKVLPTVDWFTPSGGASAHLAPLLGERVPERAVGGVHFSKEVQEPATIESSSATDLSKSVSNLNSEKEIDFWYFTLGDEDSKGVNDGGWLALQRGADGKIFATSVVVAPLRSNDSGVGHAAFSQKMEGVEKVNLNGVRELSFGGRILSGDDSGVELSSKALVSLDGRQMSGETSQRPFGKSSGRSMTYSWRAFRMVDKQG